MVKNQRLPLIDFIRGLTLLEMILYHFLWDLLYLYKVPIGWYQAAPGYIWQQSICWRFILLAGFSWNFSRNHLKRGILSISGGMIISAVTLVFLPDSPIHFGILTLLGSCILFWIPLDRILRKIPFLFGFFCSFLLFLLCRSQNLPDFVHFTDPLLNLPLLPEFLAYLGFPQAGFYSVDYFPLLPWIFLFSAGYFLYLFFQKQGLLQPLFSKGSLPGINFCGKHSFLIYLLHQPFCYLICEISMLFISQMR